jgi:LPS export ABC transporter permease LptF
MRILKFYTFKEFMPPYLGSMGFLTMLLLLERVMSLVRLVARGYADIFDLLVLIFFSIPPTLALTMPMSTIMGSLISVGRMSHDSEITAMKASGIRLSSIFLSLYITGICIGALSFYLTDRLVPVGNLRFRTFYQTLTIARPDVQIDAHSINEITSEYTMIVEKIDEKTGDLTNITIFETRQGKQIKTITAERGWFLTRDTSTQFITLRLADGAIIDPKDDTGEEFENTLFGTLDLFIPFDNKELKNIVKTPRDMNFRELRENILALEKGTKQHNTYVIEFHKKVAIPFACVLFVFLGTPFAITRGRSGRGLGLGIGILIIFLYYLLLITLERMGKNGAIPPGFAIWLPNILFFIAGFINLIRKSKV